MNAVQLYFRYLSISFQSQMQYKVSFLLQSLGQFGTTAIDFFSIWTLFSRFGQIGTWTLAEVALFYGVINTSFACADAISRGFDLFSKMIRDGGFDRLLLRPRSTVLQLLGTEFTLRRIGRLLQGLIVLGWSLFTLQIPLSFSTLWLLWTAWIGGIALFIAIAILHATLTFWTIESLEIVNILTFGGVETAQYPMSIYSKWFQRFFTFLIPLACVSYFPLLPVLNRVGNVPLWVCYVSPIAGILFLIVSLKLWRIGEHYYCSTGS